MEDHFVLFPIMIIVGLIYGVWYVIKIVWLLLGAALTIIRKIYRKIMNKNQEEVNNNVIR